MSTLDEILSARRVIFDQIQSAKRDGDKEQIKALRRDLATANERYREHKAMVRSEARLQRTKAALGLIDKAKAPAAKEKVKTK